MYNNLIIWQQYRVENSHYSHLPASSQFRSYSCEQRLRLRNISLLWWIFDFVSSSEWTTKKSFINCSEPGVGRGDGELDRRLQGCRLKHTLLTRNSQTGKEERKPQGDEEVFEVTLRTSLKLFSCPEAKMGLYPTVRLDLTSQFHLWWLSIQHSSVDSKQCVDILHVSFQGAAKMLKENGLI